MGELVDGYPGEPEDARQRRIEANSAEYDRRAREDTQADTLRHRLDALLNEDDLSRAGGSMSAVRALHALIVMEGDLTKLPYYYLSGLEWLLGHAELDHGLTWCGQWHVVTDDEMRYAHGTGE